MMIVTKHYAACEQLHAARWKRTLTKVLSEWPLHSQKQATSFI